MMNWKWDHVTKNFIAVVTVLGFFGIVALLLMLPPTIDETVKNVLLLLLGAVVALTKDVFGYFFGSSRGSDEKDQLITKKET